VLQRDNKRKYTLRKHTHYQNALQEIPPDWLLGLGFRAKESVKLPLQSNLNYSTTLFMARCL